MNPGTSLEPYFCCLRLFMVVVGFAEIVTVGRRSTCSRAPALRPIHHAPDYALLPALPSVYRHVSYRRAMIRSSGDRSLAARSHLPRVCFEGPFGIGARRVCSMAPSWDEDISPQF